jgi:transcription initiation factor IIF auxiliary subunit
VALEIKHQVVRNPDGKIKYQVFSPGGKEHYHLGVWIEADTAELDRIARVEYLLHPTFSRRLRQSANRDNKFSVTFWTWGMFKIGVRVFYKDGTTGDIDYVLSYELPPDDGSNYIRVGDP